MMRASLLLLILTASSFSAAELDGDGAAAVMAEATEETQHEIATNDSAPLDRSFFEPKTVEDIHAMVNAAETLDGILSTD
ncbi:MAG: hypothetical protein AB7G93_23115 [Bdellovibrionales bacterium]